MTALLPKEAVSSTKKGKTLLERFAIRSDANHLVGKIELLQIQPTSII